MPTIIGPLPNVIANGQPADGGLLNQDLQYIVAQVNANSADPATVITTAQLDVSKVLTTAQLNPANVLTYATAQQFGLKNIVINGNFAINQRQQAANPITLAAGNFGHDKWRAGPLGCTYSYAAASTANSVITIQSGTLVQDIEGKNIIGGTYSLTWAGTAPADVSGIPLLNGQLLGLADGQNYYLEFGLGTVAHVNFQKEIPNQTQSDYPEMRPYGLELMLCQRYLPCFNWAAATGGVPLCAGGVYALPSARFTIPFMVPVQRIVTSMVATANGFIVEQNGVFSSLSSLVLVQSTLYNATIQANFGIAATAKGVAATLWSNPNIPTQIYFEGAG